MRKKATPTWDYKAGSKTIIYQLICEAQWLTLIKDKPYQKLIEYIKELAVLKEQNLEFSISIKSAQEAIKDKRVAKWLPEIVEDLIDLNWYHPEVFKKENHNLLYRLHFVDSFDKQSFSFNLWLDKPLQLYDTFGWYFVKTKLSSADFWVNSISHDFENGQQFTSVKLISGFPNKYLDHLIEKAQVEGKLSFHNAIAMSYYELEKEIKRIYRLN